MDKYKSVTPTRMELCNKYVVRFTHLTTVMLLLCTTLLEALFALDTFCNKMVTY